MLKAVAGGGGAASGVTIGTSVITGGTNTRVLFDDSGVIGESAGLTFVKATGTLGLSGGAALGAGSWAAPIPVPYFRSSTVNQTGVLDVLANGAGFGAWIDVGTDFTINQTDGTFGSIGYYSGNGVGHTGTEKYAFVEQKTLGAGDAAPLVFNPTNSVKIGLNCIVPTEQWHAKLDQNSPSRFVAENANASTAAIAGFEARNAADANAYMRIRTNGTGFTTNGGYVQNYGILDSGPNLAGMNVVVRTGSFGIYTNGLAAGNLALTVDTNQKIIVASGKSFQLGNAAVTGLTPGALAALTNSTLILLDSSGQAYRVPAII